MASVSIRELRNEGAEILDSVMRGATVIITRQGRPIAELRRLLQGTNTADLLDHWRGTPTFDLDDLRKDLATVLDDSL